MRLVFLAFALAAAMPTAAAAQQDSGAAALQQVGAWMQRLVAIQQPVIDSYQRCGPTIKQAAALMQAGKSDRARNASGLVAPLRACIAEVKAATTKAADGFAQMDAMPAVVERALGIDSKEMLRRSAEASDGMAAYLTRIEEMVDAAVAGNAELVMEKWREARATAGSAMDGQIMMLETLRKTLPMQTHKAMLDIRLAIMRATRAAAVADPAADPSELVAALKELGADARSAAEHLRISWKSEGQAVHASGLDGRTQPAKDNTFETIAQVGDDVGAALESLPARPDNRAVFIHTLDRLATDEVRILEALRGLADAASGVR
jgi:hypothetical protein